MTKLCPLPKLFQRRSERIKRFRQNGSCCNRSTDADHAGFEQLKNKTRTKITDLRPRLTATVLRARFEGDVSVNDC